MTCPICARKPDEKYRPFCSRRCADVDLGRWLSGSYAIPAEALEEEEQAPQPDPDDRLQ
ncbi:MAG: DNA gyrase inhibitor YacG [Pseudorhodobacter sp.]|nr:DNA gyrase inhibitor YacG [Pseudorhodobacter sp.]